MNRTILLIITAAALPATLASAAQYNRISGTVCESPSDHTSIGVYSAYGLMNFNASSDMRPICAVPFSPSTISPTTVNPSQGRVDFLDANSTASAQNAGAVRCSMKLTIEGGTTVSMGTLYSCATPGGCASGNNTFTGSGYLLFPDTVGSTTNVIATSFDCVIPPYQAGWTGSSIAALAVSTSTP